MNKRITPKERGLIKGALRRVFSRSTLRLKALDLVKRPGHTDPKRPRVKKWSTCPLCATITPTYLMTVDHISPVIPVGTSFDDMSLDVVLDRLWCDEKNLQAICDTCHDKKTAKESVARRAAKINKGKKRAKK